jgi:hypothetical protein
MAADEPLNLPTQIVVEDGGPYTVTGGIPLVRKIQLISEAGEPLAWKVQGTIETNPEYVLCRCGHLCAQPRPGVRPRRITGGGDRRNRSQGVR